MAKDVTLEYSGPQVWVVELGRDVNDGDEVTTDADVAGRLLCAAGFREKGKADDEPAKLPSRAVLEERAGDLGLQLYPTETDEALASRVKFHGGSVEATAPKAKAKSSSSKKPTAKQQAEAEAAELGVSTDGTKAEIEERIADELKRREAEEAVATDGGTAAGNEGATE